MSEYVGRKEYEEHKNHMTDEHKDITRRLDALEKLFNKMNAIVVSVEKLAMSVENMQKEQIKQGEKLEEIEQIPTKNWNTVKTALITGIITAIIGVVVGALGF